MELFVRTAEECSDTDRAHLAVGVADFALGLRVNDVLSGGRGSPGVSFARHVAMYLCHVGLGMSLSRIARSLNRDRSTVAYGCHVVEDRRDDPEFDDWVDQLEQGLKALQPLQGAKAA